MDERHFKLSKRGSKSFTLRIITVTKEDRGIYSCVLKDKSLNEMWKPGTLLLPGGLYSKCFMSQLNITLNVKISKYMSDFEEVGQADG